MEIGVNSTMTALMYILVLGIVTCIVLIIITLVQGRRTDKMPEMAALPLLTKKESGIYADLQKVAAKLNLQASAKVPVNRLLETADEKKRIYWQNKFKNEIVDFVLYSPATAKVELLVIPAESGDYEARHPLAAEAVKAVGIPLMQLGNYNLPGLEKAVKSHISGESMQPVQAAAEEPREGEPEPQE